MKPVLIISLFFLTSCGSMKKRGCLSEALSLQSKADLDDNLVYIRSAPGRSHDGAASLLRKEMPIFYYPGKTILVKRWRSNNSRDDYREFNKTGLWTLEDGSRKQPDLICQDNENSDYYAYAVIDISEIKNFLIP
ncbi:MAG: hypothetical protein CME71_00315 [Halobacteriovorax sp.]|nr:hypothetical protein [Halobacteriovorax sp.]|tara:strand:- start:1574 stop:1978 length:405 start_codon:yes stop_codon:yes gene_type:complete